MSEILKLVTGDAPNYALTAEKDSATFPIDSGAVIRASILDRSKNVLAGPVTITEGTPNSDWANSLVIAQFTKLDTENITYFGTGFIELEINDGGPLTWFYKLNIEKGTID